MKKATIPLIDLESYQIYSEMWMTDRENKGLIVLVHGLGEHSGRYSTHFADYFSKQGFSILTFDLPGHGKSGGKRGHVESYNDFNEIISAGIGYLKKNHSSLPIFIYGHSLGGLISLNYAIEIQPDINGIVLSAPVIEPGEPIPPLKVFLAKIMNNLLPSFALDNGLNRSLLSRDQGVVDDYNSDPLVHGIASSRMGMFIIGRGKFVGEHFAKLALPTVIMVGADDGIVSRNAIRGFCDRSINAVEKTWDGLYHELHNEPEKKKVMQFAVKWMNNHT